MIVADIDMVQGRRVMELQTVTSIRHRRGWGIHEALIKSVNSGRDCIIVLHPNINPYQFIVYSMQQPIIR